MEITQIIHDRSKVKISWNIPTRKDFSHIIVKFGDSDSTWESATTILNNYNLNGEYIFQLPSSGTFNFFIKGVDMYGWESASPAIVTKTFMIEPSTPTAPLINITRNKTEADKLDVVWNTNPETDIDHYEISYRVNGNSLVITKESHITFTITDSNSHLFLIKAVSVAGYKSTALSLGSSITLFPTNVTNLSVSQSVVSKHVFNVTFTPSVDSCIDHYVIKYGATWDSAVPYSNVLASPYSITVTDKQSSFIFIKSVNNKGYESINSLSIPLDTLNNFSILPSMPFGAIFTQDSLERNKVILTWSALTDSDFKSFQIKPLGVSWGDSSVVETKIAQYSFVIPSTGAYSFIIRACDLLGVYSTEYTCTMTNAVLEPSSTAVDSISYVQSILDRRIFTFSWESSSESDFDHYILKLENITQGTAETVLNSNIKNSYYDVVLATQDNYRVHIINVNRIGKYSADATYSVTPNLVPTSLTGMLYTADLTRKGRGTVSWDKSGDADIDHYEIRDISVSWSNATITAGTSAVFTVNTSGYYTFEVRAKNLAGFYSPVLSLTTSINVEPSDILIFSALQSNLDKRMINFNWGTINDIDLDYFIIKKGENWDTATLLSSVTNNTTNFSFYEGESGNYTYLIKAVNKQGKESINAKAVNILLNLSPSIPTAVSVPFQTSSRDKSIVILSWGAISDVDLACYQVFCNGTLLVETLETSYQYSISSVGNYVYAVRAKNLAGYTSAFLSLYNGSITLAPSDIGNSSFNISQSDLDSRIINFEWDAVSDTDLSYYELRKGSNWETASVISTNIKSNYYQLIINASSYVDYEGSNVYMVKAINSMGFYSSSPATVTKGISFLPIAVTSGSVISSASNRFLLTVSWDSINSQDLDYYDVTYVSPSGSSVNAYRGKERSFIWDVTSYGGGEHIFIIKVKNLAGYHMSAEYNLIGNLTQYPSDVTNFVVEQSALDKRIINFSWDKNEDTDFAYYEIRKGATWDAYDGIVASNLTTNFTSISVTASEAVYYWIKAFNTGGKESQTPTCNIKDISLKPSTPATGVAYHSTSDKSNIIIKWDAVSDTDLMNYELRLAEIDLIPETDLLVWGTSPDNVLGILQSDNFCRYTRGENTSILSNKNYVISSGESYTFGFYYRNDGNSCSFKIGYNSTLITPTITDLGNGIKFAQITTSIASNLISLCIGDFSGDFTYIDIHNVKLEKLLQIKENFYTYAPNDLTTLSYDFLITARNIGGISSDVLWIPFTANFHPSNVSSITATQLTTDHTKIKVQWEAIPDKDIAYYIVKRGTNWNTADAVYTVLTQNFVEDTISAEGSYQWMIKAVNKAGIESADLAISSQYYFEMTPQVPVNVSAVQDSSDRSIIYISWQEQADVNKHQEDLQSFEVRYGLTWETSDLIVVTKEVNASWKPSSSLIGTKILIKALNNANYYSDEASSITYDFVLEPDDVVDFNAVQNGTAILFTWEKSSNADVYGYEIREGSNFDGGNIIATGITTTQFSLDVDMEITRIFHIKAINRAGRYSVNQESVTITISNLPTKNVIETYEEMPADPAVYTGTLYQAVFGTSNINCSNVWLILGKYRCSDFTDSEGTPTTECSEIGGAIVLKLAEQSAGVFYSNGYYRTAVRDLGAQITANIGTQFSATSSITVGFNAVLQYRTSLDNITWKAWRDFLPVKATFRYIQFQVLLATEDTSKTPEVPLLQEMIDVPDMDKHGTSVVLAEGSTIYYDPYYQGQVYYTKPTVVVTALETGKRAEVKQDEIFLDRFTVKVYNYNNNTTPVGGTVSWISKGY